MSEIDSYSKLRTMDALEHAGVELSEPDNGKGLKSRHLGKCTDWKLGTYQLVEVVTKYEDDTYRYGFYLLEAKINEDPIAKQLYPFEHDSAQVFVQPFVHEMELKMNDTKPTGALFTVISCDDVLKSLPGETSDKQEREDGNYEDVESRTFRIPIDLGD